MGSWMHVKDTQSTLIGGKRLLNLTRRDVPLLQLCLRIRTFTYLVDMKAVDGLTP